MHFKGNTVVCKIAGSSKTLEFGNDEDRWTISYCGWHGHVNSLQEVQERALEILQGKARIILQFRQDVLAASWLEVLHEDGFERLHMAIFINPFDPDEWDLLTGEEWVIRSECFDLDSPDPSGIRSSEVLPNFLPYFPGDWMKEIILDLMGQPPVGWRWSTFYGNEIAFPLPKGWRQNLEFETRYNPNAVVYTPSEKACSFAVQLYWSPPEEHDFRPGVAIEPTSIESFEPQFLNEHWSWAFDAKFLGQHNQLWVRFTLMAANKTDSLIAFVEQFNQYIHKTRRLTPPKEG